MSKTVKQLMHHLDIVHADIDSSTPVNRRERAAQKRERIKMLEENPEDWMRYYFPKYAKAQPAPFHIAATRRLLENPEWYEVRSWSRELAKSTRTMMEILYLTLVGGTIECTITENYSINENQPDELVLTGIALQEHPFNRIKKKNVLLISNSLEKRQFEAVLIRII